MIKRNEHEDPIHDHRGFEIPGWFHPSQKRVYNEYAQQISNGKIVEIGVYGGVSLLNIAELCARRNNTIYAVDPWETALMMNGKSFNEKTKKDWIDRMVPIRENLESIITHFEYDHIELVQKFSVEAAKTFEDESVDLIMLDADHSYDEVTKDLVAWWPKLKPGGTILGHDWAWEQVRKAVQDFAKVNGLEATHLALWRLPKRK